MPRTPFGPSDVRSDGTPLSGKPAVCHMSAPPRRAIFSGCTVVSGGQAGSNGTSHHTQGFENSIQVKGLCLFLGLAVGELYCGHIDCLGSTVCDIWDTCGLYDKQKKHAISLYIVPSSQGQDHQTLVHVKQSGKSRSLNIRMSECPNARVSEGAKLRIVESPRQKVLAPGFAQPTEKGTNLLDARATMR